jgi:hypothetical protein
MNEKALRNRLVPQGLETLVPKKGLPTALHLNFPVLMAKCTLRNGLPLP